MGGRPMRGHGLRREVKVVGQGAEGDAGSRHLGSIAPGDFQTNNLSGDALLPPGKP